MRFTILILIFVLYSAGHVASAASQKEDLSWCKASASPIVNVNVTTKPIEWIFSHNIASLTADADIKTSPYGPGANFFVEGLARDAIGMRWKITRDLALNKNKTQGCIFYKTIDVDLYFNPKVYVAREYPQGSCTHKAVKQHEIGHIDIFRTTANQYAQAIGQAIQQELAQHGTYGPIGGQDAVKAVNGMNSRIELLLRAYNNTMQADVNKRQAAHDTLAEYKKVMAMCPSGWIVPKN